MFYFISNRCPALLIVLFLFCYNSYAQNTQPFITWTGAGFKKRIAPKVNISLMNQIRFDENTNNFQSFYTDLGVSFQALPFFKINPRYRFTYTPSQNWYRIYLDLILHRSLKNTPLNAAYRFRLQYDKAFSENTSKKYIRQKVTLQYKKAKSKIVPFTEFELLYRLSETENDHFERYRIHLGTNYAIHKKHKISLQYIFQHGLNDKQQLAHILNLNYYFTL